MQFPRFVSVFLSRPARARGLKQIRTTSDFAKKVAPRAGAWIETAKSTASPFTARRAPRGRVD